VTKRRADPKVEALRAERSLNPRPDEVSDPSFAASEFFDPRDLVQVKYEMVRRVEADGVSVSEAAASFGFARQSYYTAAHALAEGGLAALVPSRPGPRGAHKLTDEVLEHLDALRVDQPDLSSKLLAEAVRDRFGIGVHPRSVERALARREAARSRKSAD